MLKILGKLFEKTEKDYCVDWDRLEIIKCKEL
jgi:hypothetical protein